LLNNPPTTTTRAVDANALDSWLAANRGRFDNSVRAMPVEERDNVIRQVVRREVETARRRG